MYELIPGELKALKQWVCWKAEPDPKSHSGISKKPINPKTGGMAQSNNPDTWSDFDTAVRAAEVRSLAGIGFMFEGSGYFGVDLDDCQEALEDYRRGDPENIIGEFILGLESYSELSYSGNGLHIICKGMLPEGARRKGKVEMYDKGRFFVMTGHYFSEFVEVEECTEKIKPLHRKYLGGKTKTSSAGTGGDISVLEKACNSSSKFKALYDGDFSGYASQSEADMAFCNMLAFWCGRDVKMMDDIYRSSGLMREKWDRVQAGSTYGLLTLEKAAAGCKEIYDPSYRKQKDDFEVTVLGSSKPEELKKPGKEYTWDDTGNGEWMADNFRNDLRYCYTNKQWMYYSNGKWRVDNVGAITGYADKQIKIMETVGHDKYRENEDTLKAWEKHMKSTRNLSHKKNMIEELRHHVPILPAEMDKEPFLVNCKNGIIDLNAGKLIPHNRELYLTRMLDSEYRADAPEPKEWLKFIDEVLGHSKELIEYVQCACGYMLSASTAEQCIFILYGNGRNGKSTFIDTIRMIMGDYAANIQPDTIMAKNKQGPNSDIARLKGVRLVTTVEPNEGSRLDEGLIKQLTGGDVVTARKLYGDEFEFVPEFKLWMATNHIPYIRGRDLGIWRRIKLIPFEVQIPEDKVDPNLKYKLAKEKEGILKWMLEGYHKWIALGRLPEPPCVKNAVKAYQTEMDVVALFVEEKCAVGKEYEIKASVLFNAYKSWAKENNEYDGLTANKFGREILLKIGEKNKIHRRDGCYYQGLKLYDGNEYSVVILNP